MVMACPWHAMALRESPSGDCHGTLAMSRDVARWVWRCRAMSPTSSCDMVAPSEQCRATSPAMLEQRLPDIDDPQINVARCRQRCWNGACPTSTTLRSMSRDVAGDVQGGPQRHRHTSKACRAMSLAMFRMAFCDIAGTPRPRRATSPKALGCFT